MITTGFSTLADTDFNIDDVLEYGKKQVSIYIARYASSLPFEQRDEIQQDAYVRILQAYDDIDFSRGWKTYIQRHCFGAVLDYIRSSSGFGESDLPRRDPDTGDELPEKKPWRLRKRLSNIFKNEGSEENEIAVDQVLGDHGIHEVHALFKNTQPRWELISRMAGQDNDIHLVGKLLLGFTQTEVSGVFRVSSERLAQR